MSALKTMSRGRDLGGGTGLVLFIGTFAFIFGLNSAAAKGSDSR